MSRRGVASQDGPGAFQAIRDEVVGPFRRLLQAAGGGADAAVAARSSKPPQGVEPPQQQQKPTVADGQGGEGVKARRSLQAVTNQPGDAQRPSPPPPAVMPSDARSRDRLALASAVYEVSYLRGCLAFPWDLAMPELNALKAAAVARRRSEQQRRQQQQSPPSTLPKEAGAAPVGRALEEPSSTTITVTTTTK